MEGIHASSRPAARGPPPAGLPALLDLYDAQAGAVHGRPPFLRRFRVRVGTRDIVVATDDVQYIVAHGVYARLHTANGAYLLREAMHWIEPRLDPASFVRIHRSCIVNAEHARELRTQPNGDRVVVLKGGQVLPISRRRRAAAEQVLLGR